MTAFFRFALSFLFLFILCPLVASGQAKPTAALIDFARSPLVTLLEAELLATNSAAWVERTEIAKLLDEQKLQKLFAADSGGERSQLGRTLKADLLVLVRSGVAEKVPYLDLVVSEVSRGLRLLRRRVPLTADATQDVAGLLKTVQQGIALQREPIKAIYAVPPFVSEDLLPDYDELRGAFSLLVEQRMLEHPGVIVVELAEAEALAREIAMADGETKVARQLPTYMLGQYRNEGRGAERTINIKLTLQQGAKTLGSNQLTMKPEAAPQYLREKTGNVVARLTGREVPPSDSKLEAAQLARRSKDFSKLGLWEDALMLIQASLLLDPLQPDMHHDAALANSHLCAQRASVFRRSLEQQQTVMGYYLRGIEHQAAFFRLGGDPRKYGPFGPGRSPNSLYALQNSALPVGIPFQSTPHIHLTPELKEFMTKVQERQIEVWLDVCRQQIAKGQDLEAFHSLNSALIAVDPDKGNDIRRSLILESQNLPNAAHRTFLLTIGFSIFIFESPQSQKFLNQLEAEGNAEVKAGVEQIRKELKRAQALHKLAEPTIKPLQAVPVGGKQAVVVPVSLKLHKPEQGGFPPHEMSELEEVDGFFPASPGLDVLWWHESIYFMRKKGEVRKVWQHVNPENTRISCLPSRHDSRRNSSVCFDGQYVWAPCIPDKTAPYLVVIDTETERTWKITQADGLPVVDKGLVGQQFQQPLTIAPLSPGRVCVAGGFERGWIAMVTFSPDEGSKVNVIHEAKLQPQPQDQEQWRNPQIAFLPSLMFVLESPPGKDQAVGKATEKIVCIGRRSRDPAALNRLLVVNTATLQVEVMPTEFRSQVPTLSFWSHDGAIYFCDSSPHNNRRFVLRRLTLPGPMVETVSEMSVDGFVVVQGNEYHAIGDQWFVGNMGDSVLQPAGPTPWQYRSLLRPGIAFPLRPDALNLYLLSPSHHYGLFAHYGNAERTSAQVKLGIAGSPEMLAAASEARDYVRPTPPAPTRVPGQGVPFNIQHVRRAQVAFDLKLASMDGCLPATSGLDAYWKDGSLYFMRERGTTKKIWEAKAPDSHIAHCADARAKSGVCFDGKYVWATVLSPTEAPRIVVADIATDKTWEITAAEGLPVANQPGTAEGAMPTLSLAAVAPGKVCVAGSSADHAWLAMITFDPATAPQIEVFHDAKVPAVPNDANQANNPAVAFQPTFMLMLATGVAGSAQQRRLLVGRKSTNASVTERPLVVNPDTRKVDVLSEVLSGETRPLGISLHQGALYSVFPPTSDPKRIGLQRLSLPGLTWEYLFDLPDEGTLMPLGEELVVVGDNWWLVDLAKKTHKSLNVAHWAYDFQYRPRAPDKVHPHALKLMSFMLSHHYGLLANIEAFNKQSLHEVFLFPRTKPTP